jgi:hypothetical protein
VRARRPPTRQLAKIRLAERLTGKETPAKGTVGTLLDGLILDYEINDYDLRFAHQWVDNHLRPWFGAMQDADSDDVDQSFRSHADQIGAKRRRALSV